MRSESKKGSSRRRASASDDAALPDSYPALVIDLKKRIADARLRAALSVNRELILLYWSIGRDILARQEREGWGAKVIDRLAADLGRSFPEMTGLSARNLKYMRAFAEAWPDAEIVQQVVAQLPWGHNVRLLDAVKVPEQRAWYARQAIENGWSRNVLVHQIDSNLFARQGSALTNSHGPCPPSSPSLPGRFSKTHTPSTSSPSAPRCWSATSNAVSIEHLRSLILELGKGFAFVGSQYHLEVGGQDYYLDLLFYHLRLRCFVVIELKIEDFKPEFAGKMNFYLSAVDDQLRHKDDQPTIGIILCKGRNEVIVEYALRDTSKPMGVAQYRLSPALAAPASAGLAHRRGVRARVSSHVRRQAADRDRACAAGLRFRQGHRRTRPTGIGNMLRDLHQRGLAPASTEQFLESLRLMNAASHGVDVDAEGAQRAIDVGSVFLNELKELGARRQDL